MKDNALTLFFLSIWPLSSLVILFLTAGLNSGSGYTTNLDHAFWHTAVLVLLGHAVAFVFPIIPAFVNRWKTATPFVLMGIIGVVTISMHSFLRALNDSLGRIDCADRCLPSVMPAAPGAMLNNLTTSTLIIIFILLFVIAYIRRAPRVSTV